jgi:hypothetical protein
MGLFSKNKIAPYRPLMTKGPRRRFASTFTPGEQLIGQNLANRSGLYHAPQARGMSRSELVRLSGLQKQQLSWLENGQIRLAEAAE